MSYRFLFICTHNRCRSILAEAITAKLGSGIIQVVSAGSQPAGAVHPLSLKYLTERGYQTQGLRSQSWDEFEDFAPHAVITLCDQAEGEACPAWFGNAIKQHWGLSDPSKTKPSETQSRAAFYATIDTIEARIKQLLTDDLSALSETELAKRLADLEGLF